MSVQQMASAVGAPSDHRRLNPEIFAMLVLGGAVLASAILGILLRPVGNLSAFWPANAVLLGLLVRFPRLARASGWAAAALAFVLADAATGSSWTKAGLLTLCNMVGAAVGYVFMARLTQKDRLLERPASLVSVMLIVLAASTITSVFGGLVNVLLFHGGPARGFFIWLATELANYIVILPIVLTFPGPAALKRWFIGLIRTPPKLSTAAPLITYVICLAMVPMVGGPGALAFPVPSLLWCALTYGLAASALLTLSFAVWTLVILSMTTASLTHLSGLELVSLRLGVMLVALAPITVASAMAERNELLREATAARKAAEDAMAARTLLLATMAHELRSPLTAIVGFSNMMAKEVFGPVGHPKYLDYAQSIELAGSHLSELVTDLLDTAKVEAGKIELSLAPVSSRDMVEQSLRLVRGLAVEAEVSLIMADGDWPQVHADQRAVKQVLINLLSNAVKFSPPSGRVEISGTPSADRLIISVRDFGRGITEEELALIGRPFVQIGDPATRRQGSGLGLALSQELVERHGGRLRLESTLGQGATARFDLPLIQ
ncbi:sensor histidine kinase [Phenylobacterium sp.]|uniref:sensor histidine kinase n=1 Tax=Phenylobacterium sp. TaxID=1871053 RepID=UPI00273089E7|nr:sensor histidine kinase [Phenylobacterium sp.]MDP1598185.1 ATP-binding protein [Phenylobacterium sp.]MDP3594847.1 ATP-binding protein [Phenylobacterium sp.]